MGSTPLQSVLKLRGGGGQGLSLILPPLLYRVAMRVKGVTLM